MCERNDSFVNKLYNRIPNKAINTRGLKLGNLEYKKMMKNPDIICSKEVSDLYDELNKKYRYMVNMKDEYIDNLHYVACSIREQFLKLGYSDEIISDMLIYYLYKNKKRAKQLFWFCYGQYVVNNLKVNLNYKEPKVIQCIDCGKWIEIDTKDTKTCRCKECQLIEKRRSDREYRRKKRMSI